MYKLDAGHGEIKRALQDAGRPVFDAAKFGGGLPDLVVEHVDGRVLFLEIKRPGPPSARKLTPAEDAFRAVFPRSYVIAQSVDEALRAVGLLPV